MKNMSSELITAVLSIDLKINENKSVHIRFTLN